MRKHAGTDDANGKQRECEVAGNWLQYRGSLFCCLNRRLAVHAQIVCRTVMRRDRGD